MKDIEIKNNLTVTRGERGGDNGRKGSRVYRNNYKGHMDKNNGSGNRVGRWGWLECWGRVRGKGRQLYLNNNKIQNYSIKK